MRHHLIDVVVAQVLPLHFAVRPGRDAQARIELTWLLDDVPRNERIVEGHHQQPRRGNMLVFQEDPVTGITVERGNASAP